MYKIALINFETGSYGHRMISSVLKHDGFDVYNIYLGGKILQSGWKVSEKEIDTLNGLLTNITPDILGFSILTMFDYSNAETLTKGVKSTRDMPIMWGGSFPTLMPEFCIERAAVDYVCVGEGENTVVELCRLLAAGKKVDDLPGVMTKNTVKFTRGTPPYELDSLPFQDISNDKSCSILPDGTVKEGDPMLTGLSIHGEWSFNTRTSRGCPMVCTYCCVSEYRKFFEKGKYLRQRSVENIMTEIKNFLKLKPDCNVIYFWDEIFTFNQSWVQEFSVEYKKHIGLPFVVFFHPATTREANVDALVSAGLMKTMVGIQSASEITRRDVFQRPETTEQILKAHSVFSKHPGLEISYDFLLDHPWESATELEDLFNLVTNLKKPFKLNMHSLILFPASSLAKRAVTEGLATEKILIENILSDNESTALAFHWLQGVPHQAKLKRAYWLFLIMCAVSPKIPLELVKKLAGNRLLKRFPQVLTDRDVLDMRNAQQFASFILSVINKSPVLKWITKKNPKLEDSIKQIPINDEVFLKFFKGYICWRVLTKLPCAVINSLLGRSISSS